MSLRVTGRSGLSSTKITGRLGESSASSDASRVSPPTTFSGVPVRRSKLSERNCVMAIEGWLIRRSMPVQGTTTMAKAAIAGGSRSTAVQMAAMKR